MFSTSVSEPGGAGSFSKATHPSNYETLTIKKGTMTVLSTPPPPETMPAFKHHKVEDSDADPNSISEGGEYEDALAHHLNETLQLGDLL
jgi:hypothetical protein